MNLKTWSRRTIGGIAVATSVLMTGCANMPNPLNLAMPQQNDKTITISEQGSFFVAGREVKAPGVYDPTQGTASTDPGQNHWVDQM